MSATVVAMGNKAIARDFSCILRFLILCLVVSFLELGLLLGIFWDYGRNPLAKPYLMMLLHVVLTLVLGLLAWYRQKNNPAPCLNGFYVLLAVATGLMGYIGILGILLALGLYLEYARSATSFESWYASLFPADQASAAMALMERLDGRGDAAQVALTPFRDILTYGTQGQKQAMIAKMSRHFKPSFASVLREAVNNPDNSIRVQAASAIAHVENSFMATSIKLERMLVGKGHDRDLKLRVARHYDDFAFTGLLDPMREEENRKKAIAGYRSCLAMDPKDQGVVLALGRTLVRSGELAEAVEFFASAMQQGHESRHMVIWFMETLYQLGHHDQLNSVARQYRGLLTGDEDWLIPIRDAVDLWSGWYNGDGLHRVGIFSYLTVEERSALAQAATIREFQEGDIIVRQGEEGHEMFVILSGLVVISFTNAQGETVEMARMGEGTFIGEMSLLTGARRQADVLVLTEKCRVMEITSPLIRPLLQGKPGFLEAIAREVALRQLQREAIKEGRIHKEDDRLTELRAARIREQMRQHMGLS
ncbi:MAG: cyclic nucleotide-binding domain-containing protein [Magnetococcales bacterium]|nr:cyclic nucleotide-binding domain-containing protein [Magnetococcales bacterium]